MPTRTKNSSWKSSPSFALISVLALVSLAALTATAFLASARLERQASSSIGKTTLLEMALNSGKVCVTQFINDYCQADLGNTAIITYWRTNWTDELGYPFIAKTKTSGSGNGQDSAMWYYVPLFSPAGLTTLGTSDIQNAMRFTNRHQGTFSNDMQTFMTQNATNGFADNPGLTNSKCVQIPLLGGRTSPPVGWVYINQEKRKFGSTLTNTSPAVRIAWFTEDLEGLIDAERMGSTTIRSTGTNSEEISLSSATGTNGAALVSSPSIFTNNRAAFISYGLVATNGGLANPTNARYFASGLRAWAPTNPASPSNGALAWIPVGIPVSGDSGAPKGYANQGYTKFNLNNLATNSGADPVATIAQVITSNLSTNFLERAGGLTNSTNGYAFDYAKCLAANIVDYIDTDSTPTYGSSGTTRYCGIELAPVVTCAALASARSNCTYNGLANTATTPPPQYIVTETLTATLSLQFWNPYDKPTPATNNVPLEFRTCPPGSESTNGLAYVIPGNSNTPITGNGSYQHFETLFPNFKSTTINIPAIPPNSYALVEVTSTTPYTWTNLSWIAGGIKPTDNTKWGMKRASSGPGLSTATIWRPVYVTHTPNSDGIKLTRGDAAASNSPWNWSYKDHYGTIGSSKGASKPLTNNAWQGYIKIGLGGSLCTMTNLYINGGDLDEDDANRSCWIPNLRLFAGTITTGTSSDSTICVGSGDPRISYFARPTNNQPLYGSSPWNYSNTYASGLSWGGRAIVRAMPTTGDAVKSNSIVTKDSVFKDASLATAPTTWLDSGHADNPFGTNSPYMASVSADRPSAPTYSSASNLFSKISSSLWKTNQAPCHIANSPLTNICELGNIFDPIMWERESQDTIGLKNSSNKPSVQHGGGNTLRIGRAEHARFAFTNMYGKSVPSIPNMAMSSAALLDLFCLTNGTNVSGGPYSLGGGKINLNTAPAPVLRALAGGVLLTNDPAQVPASYTIPPAMAEAFAQGVMRFRSKYPFLTPSHLSFIGTDPDWPNTNNWPTNSVFGNTNTIALSTAPGNTLGSSARISLTEWNDQAAEEWFSKIYALSSCQSHNLRIYVVAQLVATNSSGQTNAVGPLVKKYFQVFFQNGSSVDSPTKWPATNSTYQNNAISTWTPTGYSIDIYKSAY